MWIAHISANGPASPEVVIGPADAPDRRWPVAPRGRYPKWTAGGRELLFLEAGAIHRVVIDPATGLPVGRPAPWLELPATVRPAALQIAPDGRFLMLESVDAPAPAREIRVVLNWLEDVRAKTRGDRTRPRQLSRPTRREPFSRCTRAWELDPDGVALPSTAQCRCGGLHGS